MLYRFNKIEFRNIVKHHENYGETIRMLFDIGVPKSAIKGTLYSLSGSAKSSLIRNKLDYVEQAIGKNSLRFAKECDKLYFDRSVSSFINKKAPKTLFNKLDISLSSSDDVEWFTQTKFTDEMKLNVTGLEADL